MARMPRGQARSVPDPEGEAYDLAMRRKRAEASAFFYGTHGRWLGSPARSEANDALGATPGDKEVARYFPVTGPLMSASDNARAGHPVRAATDVAEAIADLGTPVTGLEVAEAFEKGVAKNVGRMTAEAARKQLRRRGVAGTGEEIHHSIPLNGIKRTVENWRNHPAFLKVLPQAQHRRLTGSWQGAPRYDPVRRLWIGTPDWMKTVPGYVTTHADNAADFLGSISNPAPPPYRGSYGEFPLR